MRLQSIVQSNFLAMKNLLLILSFLFLVSACSSDDPFDPNGDGNNRGDGTDNPTFVRLGIRASEKEVNIFDNIQFTLYPDRDCNMLEVRESYDSLVWLVPELDGLFKIMRPNEFTFSWSNSFYNEGKYHTILQGFKDKKMVVADTIIVNVKNRRDILGYYWKDITKTQGGLYGTADIFDSRYGIYTREVYANESPALEIYYKLGYIYENSMTDEMLKTFHEQELEKIIYNYLVQLYGEPKLSHEKDEAAIVDLYNSAFRHGDATLSPRYIWQTNTARIVLLEMYEEWGDWNTYFALAEPKE